MGSVEPRERLQSDGGLADLVRTGEYLDEAPWLTEASPERADGGTARGQG